MKGLKILAWPAYATKSNNPYNYLIYKNIENKGHAIIEFEFNIKNALKYLFNLSKYDILHIHWPTNILTYSTPFQANRRLIMFKCFVRLIQLLGKKIIWTVHNLQSHESEHPKLQLKLNQFLYKNIDGFISLNSKGLKQIQSSIFSSSIQKSVYIPHPLYIDYYPNTIDRAEARKILNINPDKQVYLFLGQIRKYKNVLELVETFKALPSKDKFLVIAGNIHEELKTELLNAVKDQPDILLKSNFIADEDLQIYLNACDLVVIPYNTVFNSGSVFLNLSFGKVTLVPKTDTFEEIQNAFGEELIKLYDGNLSVADLSDSLQPKINSIQLDTELTKKYLPNTIADQTLSFYKEVLKRES